MKVGCAILVFIAALIGLLTGMSRRIDADARAFHQRELEWMQYSAQHHCSIKRSATFGDARALWACDGFDVLHE